MARTKGAKNKVYLDIKDILTQNSPFLLNKAIKLIDEDPAKYVQLLSTLLNKIIPTQTINTNIDLTPQYMRQLASAKERADLLLKPVNPEVVKITEYTIIENEQKITKDEQNTDKTPDNDTPIK